MENYKMYYTKTMVQKTYEVLIRSRLSLSILKRSQSNCALWQVTSIVQFKRKLKLKQYFRKTIFKTELFTYLSINLIFIITELLQFLRGFYNHYAVNFKICFTYFYCSCVSVKKNILKQINSIWKFKILFCFYLKLIKMMSTLKNRENV